MIRIVPSNEALYVYREDDPGINGNMAQHNYRGAQNLRPALIYYLNNALVCVATHNQSMVEQANNAYVIVHSERPGLTDNVDLDQILLRQDYYILARAKRLSFHRC